jgi:hypothetical protein
MVDNYQSIVYMINRLIFDCNLNHYKTLHSESTDDINRERYLDILKKPVKDKIPFGIFPIRN